MVKTCLALLAVVASTAAPVCGLTLTSDGAPQAVICASSDATDAAATLQRYIEKISGARLPILTENATGGKAAILVGDVAVNAGLKVPGPTPSREAYAVRSVGNRLLIAGESARATEFAAYHLLETLGCRWFMPGEIGEVVPSMKTVEVGALDIREKPDFDTRRIWGSGFRESPSWCLQNRAGGLPMATRHIWSELVPENKYWAAHPEYFSLINGERKPRQLCTSNPEVVKAATQTVLDHFGADPNLKTASLSPNDGGGFCQCDDCRNLDVAGYFEPSSGGICLSDRLQIFYNSVAREVGKKFPDRILNYYAYADYTLPPKRETKLEPNLMVWVAPIRHCRLHGIGSADCASRDALGKLIDDWSKIAPRIGYRTYNFNLAECIAPYSKISVWKQEIPFLKARKCTAIDFETLAGWAIEGPHIYLSARLGWDADADVDAVMADYYEKFFGKAAPHVKAYWERIDRAFAEARTHAGGFQCLSAIYAPELLAACAKDLDAAENAADSEIARKRVQMFRRGLENARMYMQMHNAFTAGDFSQAKTVYDKLLAHCKAMVADGLLNQYGATYLQRFIEPKILEGHARSTGDCKVIARLPDAWNFRYDPDDKGEAGRFWAEDSASDGWQPVKTYSSTLEEQGIAEQMTFMWYSVDVNLQTLPQGKLFLWFSDVDGAAKVWVNGKVAGEGAKAREPFDVDVSRLMKAGANHIAVRVDHSRLTELALGGILGPAIIYSAPQPPH